ncbi:hypothetical protein L873DRAFT_1829650 [Choiromyces venosus 120613-1]|uniref:HIT-type domain-containing protein n=1 Tax=Choiromyces venosus 120613-1 TaxID=1336337 RepID=A0A3N4JGN6_9PEZI|nr:hypothetical protein L873DRAFT_1829650 [Choiromyces venosus 120613-1]
MPTIQVLPNTSTSSGANWTYSNLPPALAHTNSLPSNTARAPRSKRANNTENTAARQRQINSRILDLERDNYRDAVIVVGKGGVAGRSSSRNKSQNVRRILASQKTFANHLADEEALHPTPAVVHRQRVEEEDAMDLDGDLKEGLMNIQDPGQPLGYAASASKPSTKPKRVFCEICGYWGKYKCQKCSARYCGLQCGGVHSETKCNKFYA